MQICRAKARKVFQQRQFRMLSSSVANKTTNTKAVSRHVVIGVKVNKLTEKQLKWHNQIGLASVPRNAQVGKREHNHTCTVVYM